MIFVSLSTALLLLLLLLDIKSAVCDVNSDDFKRLEKGEARLFYGMIMGDPSQVSQALEESASVHAPLDPFIGEKVLLIGKAFVDFPVCPPLHMALLHGKKGNLNVAAMLLRQNLDANKYVLPPTSFNLTNRGYPPALMYGLGFGQKPTNAHAAMIQRLYRSYPSKFNVSVLEEWRQATANPPLVHQMIYLHNFDGLYVMVTELHRNMFELDPVGNISALHIAAWFGDVSSVVFLLHNRANPFQATSHGHLPIHFAIFRQHQNVFAILFAHVMEKATSIQAKRSQWEKLMSTKDKLGRDMIDMILQPPRFLDAYPFIANLSQRLEFPLFAEKSAENKQRQLTFDFILKQLRLNVELDFAGNDNKDPGSISSIPMSIDKQSAKQLNKERFMNDYYDLQRPVLITDGAADGLGIWAYLQSSDEVLDKDVFFGRYGDLPFRAFSGSDKVGPLREIATSLQYLFSEKNASDQAKSDECLISSNPIADSCASQQRQLESKTGMSGQVIVTPSLYHAASLSSDFYQPVLFQSICKSGFYDSSRNRDLQLEQLLGLDTFNLTFLQPYDSHHFVSTSSSEGGGEHVSQSWSAVLLGGGKVTWYMWSAGIDSALRRSNWNGNVSSNPLLEGLRGRCLVHEIEQRVGEVLYVPDGYNAIALANDEKGAMILTQSVCKWINTQSRLQRLGYVVYGDDEDDYRGYGLHHFHHYPVDALPKKVYKASSKVPIFD